MRLLFLSLVFATPSLFALPKVGDFSKYRVYVNGVSNHTVTKQLKSFDPVTKQFDYSILSMQDDGTILYEINFPSKERDILAQVASVRQTLGECGAYSTAGTKEALSTSAGNFDTCRFEHFNRRDIRWHGDVLSGYVKQSYIDSNGDENIEVLESFSWE